MSVREHVRVLREQWLVVLVSVAVLAAAGAAVWGLRPAAYTATLTLYVSAQTGDNAQTAYQGGLLSQERVKSYVELLGSTRVSGAVVDELGLTSSPAQVARQISAASEVDSVIINVAVTDRSAAQAARIADAVGDVFVQLVDELERPSTPDTSPPVQVRVVEQAGVPTTPSTPNLALMLAFGALLGLVVGIAVAAVRQRADTSVSSPEELNEITGTPTLAVVAHDTAARKLPLTTQQSSQSPRSEAFRQLRTNLQFLDVDHRHQVLVVTSPLAGEGKTTTVLNLAIALVADGRRVLVIDADLRRPTVAAVLGLEPMVGLTSVLTGRADVETVIQRWAGGLDVIASGPLPPNPSEMMGSQHMREVLAQVRPHYDVVLLDSPPLLPVTDAATVAPAADGVLLVSRCRRTTTEQVRRAMGALTGVSARVLGTVLTMAPARGPGAYAQYNAGYQRREPGPDQPGEQPTYGPPPAVGRHHVDRPPGPEATRSAPATHSTPVTLADHATEPIAPVAPAGAADATEPMLPGVARPTTEVPVGAVAGESDAGSTGSTGAGSSAVGRPIPVGSTAGGWVEADRVPVHPGTNGGVRNGAQYWPGAPGASWSPDA